MRQPNVRIAMKECKEMMKRVAQVAAETGQSMSDVLRDNLYSYYGYQARGSVKTEMYEHCPMIGDGCYVLPVEDGFTDLFLSAILSRPGSVQDCYRSCVMDALQCD